MSSRPPDEEPACFACYGTLRDDDDSGAPWTQAFIEGASDCFGGCVPGFKMYVCEAFAWPFAVYTGTHEDLLVVRVISFFADRQLARKKLSDADKIEDYDDSREEITYLRKLVRVQPTNGPLLSSSSSSTSSSSSSSSSSPSPSASSQSSTSSSSSSSFLPSHAAVLPPLWAHLYYVKALPDSRGTKWEPVPWNDWSKRQMHKASEKVHDS